MALIPSKAKSNHIDDSGISFEVIMVIFVFIIIGQKVFEDKVHSWLSWVLLLLMGVIGLYLVIPSSKNHGRIGYFRVLYLIRFKVSDLKKKRKLKR